ncbi:bucky ball [Trichomycterus rosablanca]|uniref:bucky ball n=1 Tax=Trichomycterus rosablanca TaxID=2290929 RepID=UPI002F35B0BD
MEVLEVNPSQSDVEQPHPPVNHSRPFFYVQPPSQPYFMYQWPMDPFGQYGFPGSAFPFGRPYMPPYQYMQYPGYVVPHAPMQPTDYRRMSPFLPSVASYDLRFRQHFQQMSMHRETMSAEAQTESRDSVSKVMDCLNGLQVCEKSVEPNMVSSTPAVTPYTHEVEKLNSEPLIQFDKVGEGAAMPTTLSDSAMYDESSQGRLEECVLSDVLPLDSSSIHEESQDQDDPRNAKMTSLHGKINGSDHIDNRNITSDLAAIHDSGAHVSEISEKSDLCETTSVQSEGVKNLPPVSVDVVQPLMPTTTDYDLPYQILHLPCDKATSGLLLHKEVNPMAYMNTASTLLPTKRYSFGGAYHYSYYPQVAPERQSVLSPSLDELSSRDEMFSTDVEDDPTSAQVYVDGDKLSETSGVPIRSDKDHNDACPVCANTCACCGASLPDEDEAQEPSDQDYGCELDVGDLLIAGEAQRSGLRQHFSRPPCGQQVARHKDRKVQEEEMTEQDQGHGRRECGVQPYAATKEERVKGKGPKCSQTRAYTEHYQREGPGQLLDQETWTSSKGNQRSRSSRPVNGLQEKGRDGRPPRRRPSCKTFAQQRPRRNEYDDHDDTEYSFSQRGRGSLKRRGTRY